MMLYEFYFSTYRNYVLMNIKDRHKYGYLYAGCFKIFIFKYFFQCYNGSICGSKNGKYLVAWHPKSSFENEHTSIIIESASGKQIKVSQIAGIIARRIVINLREGDEVMQGDELGFIFFGSRVDLYLPLWARIKIKPGDKVKAKYDIIAEINDNNSEPMKNW